MPAPKKIVTFETAIERLKQIAARMESEDILLDDLIDIYEEGLGLVRFCSAKLDDAEKRLETITRGAAGLPTGIAELRPPPETQSSTPSQTSATQQDSGASAGPSGPARLH